MKETTFINLVQTQCKLQIEMNKELSLNDIVKILLDRVDKKAEKTLEDNK